ncbi:hypothetical protein [Pseudarthrobacter sp. W1I19]|uniref:hypothetical protein n=1 Tax=Pseudarthrobacter sp. W1I19 TaxID=3042288 RepID=UPI0027D90A16|nr:hypothetical protein [Pseudarthrobacter sp. W1I19]
MDVIQVELVGTDWWEKALPILAILISIGTLAWTMVARQRDQARLKVIATSFTLIGEGPWGPRQGADEWHVAVDVTNVGRTGSTVVSSVKFKLPSGVHLQSFESYRYPQPLPKTLAPGESLMYVFNVDAMAEELSKHSYRPEQLVPLVVSGHGPATGKWAKAGLDILKRRVEAKSAAASAHTSR